MSHFIQHSDDFLMSELHKNRCPHQGVGDACTAHGIFPTRSTQNVSNRAQRVLRKNRTFTTMYNIIHSVIWTCIVVWDNSIVDGWYVDVDIVYTLRDTAVQKVDTLASFIRVCWNSTSWYSQNPTTRFQLQLIYSKLCYTIILKTIMSLASFKYFTTEGYYYNVYNYKTNKHNTFEPISKKWKSLLVRWPDYNWVQLNNLY